MSSVQKVKITTDHIEYDLRYFPGGKSLEKSWMPIVIDPDEALIYFLLPAHICGEEKYLIPLTDKIIIQVEHWTTLWAANVSNVLLLVARLKKNRAKLLFSALRACSFNQWKILSTANKVGRKCDIHHTAYIEGSVVGDNVTIGAGSIIREALIGNNVFIGNNVVVEGSVVGERSTIVSGHILYSVIYPGLHSTAQTIYNSLVGKDSFIASGVVLTDFRFDKKNVVVLRDGVKVDTENKILGCCLGNGVYLGSGCVIAPGRVIPSGLRITVDESRVITNANNEAIDGFRIIKC